MVDQPTQDVIDVIIRFHDVNRLYELERAVFSLCGQEYRPINIILALQRFDEDDIGATRAMLEKLIGDDSELTYQIINWNNPEPKDGRSALMSLGMRQCRGRYMAFLDYDDTLYPEAYRLLTEVLRSTDSGIAFASLRLIEADVFEHFVYARSTKPPFEGKGLADLLHRNFCPIHSFVVDRSKLSDTYLYFDSSISLEEDYDFLIRVCSTYRSDFSLIGTCIGDYYYKTDGSNTIPADRLTSQSFALRYQNTVDFMESRKRLTYLSASVLESVGMSAKYPLTIAEFLDRQKRIGLDTRG